VVVDSIGEGDTVEIKGDTLVNMGNCSYLGLNTDPRVKAAAIEAVERFTPFYASSARYAAPSYYGDLRSRLETITGGPVLIGTTTTLTHLGALPVLVTARDYVLVDLQGHATLQMATELLQARSIPVATVPHNDMGVLEERLDALQGKYEKIWYLADGVYSMYGDTAPMEELERLLSRYENLHLYLDDAHGFAWMGKHGRGLALEHFAGHERVVVAAGLAKGFGSGGAVLAFSDPDMPDNVGRRGSTFTFSGPIPSANLGAAVCAADIMLSLEGEKKRIELKKQMQHTLDLLHQADLTPSDESLTPIWFVPVGSSDNALKVARDLMDRGFFPNVSFFPVVPLNHAGIRFTNTLSLSHAQIELFVTALSESVTKVVGPQTSYIREIITNSQKKHTA
jgi:7-keto-8-aminopelargonate synthetase-like enzyme